MNSNSQCCFLSIIDPTPPQLNSTTIYVIYSTTIYIANNCTLDSKTAQVPSSLTFMTISETLLTKYVTVCPPVSYQTPSPCLSDMLPFSNSQEYKATAESTAPGSLSIREKLIYSVGAVAIALLLGTNISLCVALWIKRNQLKKSEHFSCLKNTKQVYLLLIQQADLKRSLQLQMVQNQSYEKDSVRNELEEVVEGD